MAVAARVCRRRIWCARLAIKFITYDALPAPCVDGSCLPARSSIFLTMLVFSARRTSSEEKLLPVRNHFILASFRSLRSFTLPLRISAYSYFRERVVLFLLTLTPDCVNTGPFGPYLPTAGTDVFVCLVLVRFRLTQLFQLFLVHHLLLTRYLEPES